MSAPKPITNSYRVQSPGAAAKLIKQLGPSQIRAGERDELVRVLEDLADRLREKMAGGSA